jgi:SPP1 family predicted phage head-tail adaptor
MRIGSLRVRAQLQRRNSVDDGMGGAEISYTTITSLWIGVSTQLGRELVEAKKLNARVSHFVTARFRSDVKPDMRLVYGETVLDIKFVGDPTHRHHDLTLLCEEVVQ